MASQSKFEFSLTLLKEIPWAFFSSLV